LRSPAGIDPNDGYVTNAGFVADLRLAAALKP
jgi:hypothetical protein